MTRTEQEWDKTFQECWLSTEWLAGGGQEAGTNCWIWEDGTTKNLSPEFWKSALTITVKSSAMALILGDIVLPFSTEWCVCKKHLAEFEKEGCS